MSDNDNTSNSDARKDPAQVTEEQPVSGDRVQDAAPDESEAGVSGNDSPGGTPEMDGEPGPAAPQLHPEVFDHGDRPDDEPSA